MNNYNSCAYPMQRQGGMTEGSCSCVCNHTAMPAFPDNTPVAMAYVPFQSRGEVYKCDKALMRGTLFPCLDKPFTMGCCR